MKSLFTVMISLLISCSVLGKIPGWPDDRIAMGTVVSGGSEFDLLKTRPVDAVFTYAGIGGDGDRGQIIALDPKVAAIMPKTRDLEKPVGHNVMPVFVFYSVNASGGIWGAMQDLDVDPARAEDYLWKHYVNLIYFCKQLESYKDAQHPIPATVILNPDFLGEIHKTQGDWYSIPIDQPIDIKDALSKAINYTHASVKIPEEFLTKQTKLPDYVASINWIMHTFAPDVPFGWQDNVWLGDKNGHLWIHQARTQSQLITEHVTTELEFLDKMQVYKNSEYRPNFLVFDKYERDIFDRNGQGGSYVAGGYLYNAVDLNVYMQLVKEVGKGLNNIPVMLWQIPGGHLQITNDADPRDDHASTEPDYFFGDNKLAADLKNLKPYIDGPLNANTYNVSELPNVKTVVDYLNICPNGETNCWQTGHMNLVKQANVFAILWGGGSTTGIAGTPLVADDNGWLFAKISSLQIKNEKIF